jgi:hypothetical protein
VHDYTSRFSVWDLLTIYIEVWKAAGTNNLSA